MINRLQVLSSFFPVLSDVNNFRNVFLGTSKDSEKLEASRKRKEETKKEKAAYKRLAKDIPRTEEDHLDTGLELESEYLHKYLSFLNS